MAGRSVSRPCTGAVCDHLDPGLDLERNAERELARPTADLMWGPRSFPHRFKIISADPLMNEVRCLKRAARFLSQASS